MGAGGVPAECRRSAGGVPVELYSDLLLHDVLSKSEAETRARSRAPEAAGFRTPPLRGVSTTAPYLHDGRAETLRDAILARDVEAAVARAQFVELDDYGAKALIAFLEDH